MGRHDWFRNETWTPQVKAAFRERLERSRGSFHKSQYLRIQAYYLACAGYHEAAIELLDELFQKYPHESQVASARLQRAECLLALGRMSDMVEEFRSSLQAERDNPTVKTGAWLNFASVVAFQGMSHLYGEASSVLEEFAASSSLLFPSQRFQYAAARALIAHAQGKREDARSFAKAALQSAAAEHSGFRYHPQFGLVDGLDKSLEDRLAVIASEE